MEESPDKKLKVRDPITMAPPPPMGAIPLAMLAPRPAAAAKESVPAQSSSAAPKASPVGSPTPSQLEDGADDEEEQLSPVEDSQQPP